MKPLLLLLAMSIYSISAEVSTDFLSRLATIESGRDDLAVNSAEDAHGRYQIRAGYLADANESLGTSYTLQDMHDPDKAEKAATLDYGQTFLDLVR